MVIGDEGEDKGMITIWWWSEKLKLYCHNLTKAFDISRTTGKFYWSSNYRMTMNNNEGGKWLPVKRELWKPYWRLEKGSWNVNVLIDFTVKDRFENFKQKRNQSTGAIVEKLGATIVLLQYRLKPEETFTRKYWMSGKSGKVCQGTRKVLQDNRRNPIRTICLLNVKAMKGFPWRDSDV